MNAGTGIRHPRFPASSRGALPDVPTGDSIFCFSPRGLDIAHSYNVRFGNSGQTAEIPGDRLLQEGIPIRIENPMGSELVNFESR